MSTKISELLDSLPDDIRLVASGLIDSVAEGFLDSGEAFVGSLINGNTEAAFQSGLRSLSTKGLVDFLMVVNMDMSGIAGDYEKVEAWHKFMVKQITTLAFALLRKEVLEEIKR